MGEESHDKYGRIKYTQRVTGPVDSASSDVDDGMGDVHNGGNDEWLRRLVGGRCFFGSSRDQS